MLFLNQEELEERREPLLRCLSHHLPVEIHGYPTHFINLHSDSGLMKAIQQGPVTPYISITSPEQFFLGYAGVDITRPLTAANWLSIPWQRLATIHSGRVFYDGLGRLLDLQESLNWYSHDLWLYTLAAQWRQIDQEEPFMGRCGDAGDELGSRDVSARLVHRLMELCFLMEKHWPPYSKWFGTAFSSLKCAADLQPLLMQLTAALDWKTRQALLSEVYLRVGEMHNRLEITRFFIQPEISFFYSRPYRVPHAGRFVDALRAAIQSDEVLALPRYAGSIDQFVDNTDILESIALCQQLKTLYLAPIMDDFPDPGPLIDPLTLPEDSS